MGKMNDIPSAHTQQPSIIDQEYGEPLVSVLLPAYQVERYLERCVKSVMHQTYRNLEIVIVDDCSPDNSGQIAEGLAQQDTRITVVHHTRNLGFSGARNSGIEHSTGEYVTFVDSDDWVEPDYVSYLMNIVNQTSCDVAMSRNFFTSRSHVQISADSISTISPEDMLCDIFYNRIHVGVWNRIYRRSLFEGKRFRLDALTGEGMQFNTQVLPCAKSIGVGLRCVYTYNVDNDTSATKQPNVKKQAFGSIKTMDIIKETLVPRSERLNDAVEYQYFTTALYALSHLLRSGANKQYGTFYHRLIRYIRKTAPKTLSMDISPRQKLKSLLVLVSPVLTMQLSIFWRYRIGIKQRV